MKKVKTYSGLITSLLPHQIFCFGSNPQGRHGGGAARVANKHYGAVMGEARGMTGQSYALPTKNLTAGFVEKETGIKYEIEGERSVSRRQIILNIIDLYIFALKNQDKEFLIAYTLSPNLNGYTPKEMAEMFTFPPVPVNIVFNDEFIGLQ